MLNYPIIEIRQVGSIYKLQYLSLHLDIIITFTTFDELDLSYVTVKVDFDQMYFGLV